jgi:hypothetical protein
MRTKKRRTKKKKTMTTTTPFSYFHFVRGYFYSTASTCPYPCSRSLDLYSDAYTSPFDHSYADYYASCCYGYDDDYDANVMIAVVSTPIAVMPTAATSVLVFARRPAPMTRAIVVVIAVAVPPMVLLFLPILAIAFARLARALLVVRAITRS